MVLALAPSANVLTFPNVLVSDPERSARHMATVQLSPDSAEQAFIDQVIAKRSGRPGALLGILEAVQEHNPHKYLLGRNAAVRRQPGWTFRCRASTASPRSTRCSTWSRRATTPSASAAARPATRATRAPCWRACAWSWGWARTTARSRRRRQAGAHHRRREVHRAHGGLLRAMRAGAGGRDQSPHLRARERTHPAARGPRAGTGE